MRKTYTAVIHILLSLYAVVPVCTIVGDIVGYSFEVRNYFIASVVMFFIAAALSGLLCFKTEQIGRLSLAEAVLFFIFSVIIWFAFLVKSESIPTTVISASACIFSVFAAIRVSRPLALKFLTGASALLLFVLLCFFSFVGFLFKDFGKNTVIETVKSPSGEFEAVITDVDQGALGGDTLVEVRFDRGIDLYLFRFRKNSERVYMGEWRAYENMEVYWTDSDDLVIISGGKRTVTHFH